MFFSKLKFNIVSKLKNIDQTDSILKSAGYILFDNLYFNMFN